MCTYIYIYRYIYTHTVNSVPLLRGGGAVPKLWIYDEMKVEDGKSTHGRNHDKAAKQQALQFSHISYSLNSEHPP